MRLVDVAFVAHLILVVAQENQETCDSLKAQGTNILCTPPSQIGTPQPKDCSQPSLPGTVAAYACRNAKGEVVRGILNCTKNGYWLTSMSSGSSSLCNLNLDASIIHIQSPDVAIAFGLPGFTTPVPDPQLWQTNAQNLNDFERAGLQLHNIFRRNHGVPLLSMSAKMNAAAQELADFLATGQPSALNPNSKLSLFNETSNVEMNWYIQQPASVLTEAVSNAVQSWYSTGFPDYDWSNVDLNLNKGHVLAFARVIWKSTQIMGIGVSSSNDLNFVVALYSPGRNVANPNSVEEFRTNVLPVRIGSV